MTNSTATNFDDRDLRSDVRDIRKGYETRASLYESCLGDGYRGTVRDGRVLAYVEEVMRLAAIPEFKTDLPVIDAL